MTGERCRVPDLEAGTEVAERRVRPLSGNLRALGAVRGLDAGVALRTATRRCGAGLTVVDGTCRAPARKFERVVDELG